MSRKDFLRTGAEVDSFGNPELDVVMHWGGKEEVERLKGLTELADGDCFIKSVYAWDGFIQPSPTFLSFSPVEQVEYALHEAYHQTKKDLFTRSDEEPHACVVGHLGAIDFFRGTNLEKAARSHWQRVLNFSKQVHDYYWNLFDLYKSENTREYKMAERERILSRAREEIGTSWGTQINNAFFVYWNYFYGGVERSYGFVEQMKDFKSVVRRLTL